MAYLGSWKIDDALTFYANTTRFDTGNATDADSVPTYRVYEDETTTPILTGSMALLDGSNTAGFYSEQITLSAANGFEKGKCYAVYITATVNSVAGAMHHSLQIEAEVDTQSWNALATVALPLIPTTAGRALDVSTGGEAGLDWANVGSPTTTVGLSGTTVGTATALGAGAVSAAAVATGAIDADALAADVITDIWQGTALTEAYAADGAAATPAQLLYMIWAALAEFAIASTTITAKKLDGSTAAMTFTLDDATNPTSRTRAT